MARIHARRLVTAAAIGWALLAAPDALAGKRYALLVAINKNHVPEGQLKDLEYAISDAQKLAALLKKQGFEDPTILTDVNAGRAGILRELSWHARAMKPEDEFVLFYSGHGVRNTVVNGQSYWMAYGAAMSSLDETSIRLSHLLDYVREMKPAKKLVLLDHCFSGDVIQDVLGAAPPPAPGGARSVTVPPVGLEKTARIVAGDLDAEISGKGVIVLAAARHFAYESNDLQQGVFTKALLNALETPAADASGDGALSVPELVEYVSNWVKNYQGAGRQVPVTYMAGAGLENWIFAPNLPTTSVNQVVARIRGYEDVLDSWQGRGRITYDTKARALSLLGKWKQAEEAQTPLPADAAALLARMQQALDSSHLPEDGRQRDLDRMFTAGGQ